MNIKDTLIKDFVNAINAKPEKKTTMYYGEIVEVANDSGVKKAYVHLDGSESDIKTPIVEGTEVMEGDRVLVTIENHQAVVLANITSPASARTAKNYMDFVDEGDEGLSGLKIGDMMDDDHDFNVLIASDGVYVRDGQSILALYGGNGTQLYSEGELAAEFTPEGIRFFSDLDGYARDDLTNVNNGWLSGGIIIAGSIGELEIADGAITTAKIGDAAITSAKIGQAAIGSAHIQDAAITNAKIKNAEIDSAKIKDAAITTAKIDNAAITSAKIEDAAITTAKINNAAITSAKIEDAAITTAKIDDAAITTAKIDNAAITTAKIDDAAITTAKIGDAAITSAKIGEAEIKTANIDDAAITNAKIGLAAIHTANIEEAAITTALIAREAVTSSQILSVSANKLTAGTIDASKINVANLRAKNLIVERLNGQPIIGGYELVSSSSSNYSSKNPVAEGWFEFVNGNFVASTDTTVDETKAYYRDGEQVALYDQEYIDNLKFELNQRIDGAVDTYTGTDIPTLLNYPAGNWTSSEYASHVGNIFYVMNDALPENGYCYRFAYDNATSTYDWVLIKDSDVTAALADISDLKDFRSETYAWKDETDEGLRTVRNNQTSLAGIVDKTVKETVQLWWTNANTTNPPQAPQSVVTNNHQNGSQSYNQWNLAVPVYNASYPYYYYCWQYRFVDNTYGWSAVVYDQATTEAQERARTGVSIANANIKSSVQLWYTKSTDDPPQKPNSVETTRDAAVPNHWNLLVPTYNANYPHYFYCYQQQKGNDEYQWTDVVYDRATTESQSTARATSSALANYIQTNDDALESIKNQVDGQLDIWYGSVTPTTSNEPATSWSAEEKESHLGDMYYNNVDGGVWQWSKNGSTYFWKEIPNSSAAVALEAAEDAQATADGKRRIFVTTPTVPYDIGDLWVNGSTVKYASVAKTENQSYSASDWQLTATDDTMAKVNIKSSVQLWRTVSESASTPGKPYADGSTNFVNSVSTSYNVWTTVVPTYNANYPKYYYCYQQQRGDNTYQWTDPVYDQATSEAMSTAKNALSSSDFEYFEQNTFKELVDDVNENSTTITRMSTQINTKIAGNFAICTDSSSSANKSATITPAVTDWELYPGAAITVRFTNGNTAEAPRLSVNNTGRKDVKNYNGNNLSEADRKWIAGTALVFVYDGQYWRLQDSSVVTLSNTVSTVRQTAETNEQTLANITNVLGTNADGTTKENDISYRMTSIEQNFNEYKTTVANTYVTTTDLDEYIPDIDLEGYATEEYADGAAETAEENATRKLKAHYAISSTAAATAIKEATIKPEMSDWELYRGAMIVVKFTNANTNATPSLKINTTDAKRIRPYTGGTTVLSEAEYKWVAGSTMAFVYDGTDWLMQDSTTLTRISEAYSKISQTADSIVSLVANNEQYTKPDGTVATNTFHSEIEQAKANISMKVDANGVIAAINLSSETDPNNPGSSLKIHADKINIDGAAIFTTGRLSPETLSETYATSDAIPTALSDLNNDTGFITDEDIPDVPTKMTDLTNDAGFVTETQVGNAITSATSGKADKSTTVIAQQRIYYRSSANQKPNGEGVRPTTWVANNGNVWNTTATNAQGWTTKVSPILNPNDNTVPPTKYLYLWTCVQTKLANNDISLSEIVLDDSTTIIDGGTIITNSITSTQLSTDAIQSTNYRPPTVNGTAPYSAAGTKIDLSDGNIYATKFMLDSENGNAYLNGHIETESGHIGGFTITDRSIYNNKTEASSVTQDGVNIAATGQYLLDDDDYLSGGYASQYGVYLGLDGIALGHGNFFVNSSGEMYASDATLIGSVTAHTGEIGGWTVNQNSLSRTDTFSTYQTNDISLTNQGLIGTVSNAQDTYTAKYNTFQTELSTGSGDRTFIEPGYAMFEEPDWANDNFTTIDGSGITIHSTAPKVQAINLTGGDMCSLYTATNGDRGIYDETMGRWVAWTSGSGNTYLKGEQVALTLASSGPNVLYYQNDSNNYVFRPINGDVYCATQANPWKGVYGEVVVQTSDLKKKEIIDDHDWKVDEFIKGLKPIAFKFKDGDSGRVHMGFGAQDVSKLAKELDIGDLSIYEASIKTDENECISYHGEEIDDEKLAWGLKYNEFIAPMVLEMQKLMSRVDKLEEENLYLKEKLNEVLNK